MQVVCNIFKTLDYKTQILKYCLILQISFVGNRRKGVKFVVSKTQMKCLLIDIKHLQRSPKWASFQIWMVLAWFLRMILLQQEKHAG